jgi:hypothetical protein
MVRDQEVEGSNPFAPTTSKTLPFIGLRYLLLFEFLAVGGTVLGSAFLWTLACIFSLIAVASLVSMAVVQPGRSLETGEDPSAFRRSSRSF